MLYRHVPTICRHASFVNTKLRIHKPDRIILAFLADTYSRGRLASCVLGSFAAYMRTRSFAALLCTRLSRCTLVHPEASPHTCAPGRSLHSCAPGCLAALLCTRLSQYFGILYFRMVTLTYENKHFGEHAAYIL